MIGLNGQNPNDVLPDRGFAFAINPRQPNYAREQVASFVNRRLAEMRDPSSARKVPMAGEDAVPHAVTFGSLIGSYSSVYLLPEESVAGAAIDSLLMRQNLGIMECLEIRQRVVAEIDWEIEPPDKNHPGQKKLAAELTQIIQKIRRFTEYRRNMQEAIWYGRAGIQHAYNKRRVGDQQYVMPYKPGVKDHPGWMPIHGDKILFRYDDGREMPAGAFPHQMGIRVSSAHFPTARDSERKRAEPTAHGMAIFLRPWERETILVHKHMIEDSDFNDVRTAGRIHGVGIRTRIHKEWILATEVLAFLMNYLERSAGGIEIWEYPAGNVEAKKACIESANNRAANGRNILFFPRPPGDDASLYDLKIVEAGFQGIDLLSNLNDKYFGHRIKRYILGQTLTTEADATGLGSGVADAHKDTFHQIVLYDGASHEETLSCDLLRPIQLYNFPETEPWEFRLRLKFESDDTEQKLNGYRNAWEMGARIKEQDVLDAIGAAVPNDNDRLLPSPNQGAGGAGAGGAVSPFGNFPSGTSVVSAAVQHSVGKQVEKSKADQSPDDQPAGQPPAPEPAPSTPDVYSRPMVRALNEAAAKTDTNPSEAQKKAGNYAKGVFAWRGMEIAIENPKGSERRGVSASGREWSRTMACHYGYFRRTEASDGDQLDVYIGSHPHSEFVLVIKQIDQATGKFDEFKVVIGCLNRKQAKRLYLANYPAGWKCGLAASMTVEQFRRWVSKGGALKAKMSKADRYSRTAEFDESKHPRDSDGQFTEKGSAGDAAGHGAGAGSASGSSADPAITVPHDRVVKQGRKGRFSWHVWPDSNGMYSWAIMNPAGEVVAQEDEKDDLDWAVEESSGAAESWTEPIHLSSTELRIPDVKSPRVNKESVDMDSVRGAMADGATTPEQVADWIIESEGEEVCDYSSIERHQDRLMRVIEKTLEKMQGDETESTIDGMSPDEWASEVAGNHVMASIRPAVIERVTQLMEKLKKS